MHDRVHLWFPLSVIAICLSSLLFVKNDRKMNFHSMPLWHDKLRWESREKNILVRRKCQTFILLPSSGHSPSCRINPWYLTFPKHLHEDGDLSHGSLTTTPLNQGNSCIDGLACMRYQHELEQAETSYNFDYPG